MIDMIINMNGAKAPETPSSVLQEKTVTPETLPTVIGPDEGYDGLSQVTVNPDSQLKAENIRSGKTIFGVAGTFVGGESSSQLLKAIAGASNADGSYAEELTVSTFPEDLGQPNMRPYTATKFLNMGVAVGTLYVDSALVGTSEIKKAIFQDKSTSKTTTYPAKVICTTTTGTYYGATINGCLLGLPEIPSGGNDRFLASNISATIVVGNDGLTIDDTHWFNNEPYKGYNYCNLNTLGADGSVGSTAFDTVIHFKRNISTLSTDTLTFYSSYKVRFYSETPPTLEGTPFNYNLTQLIVPKGLLETYQNASGWSQYASKIVEATE